MALLDGKRVVDENLNNMIPTIAIRRLDIVADGAAALFGVDANGDGVPDRGAQDRNNDGWMDAIVSGTTDNGVPLYEDVRARSLRPINKTHIPSDGHTSDMDNLGSWTDRVSRYSFQANADEPIVNGVGKQNNGTGAAPALPELKANLSMGWTRGNYSIVSTVHYVDHVEYDGPLFKFMDFFGGTYRPADIRETGIKAWTDMDIACTYRGLQLFDGELALSVGSRNVFNREAQPTLMLAGVQIESFRRSVFRLTGGIASCN